METLQEFIAERLRKIVCPTHFKSPSIDVHGETIHMSNICCDELKDLMDNDREQAAIDYIGERTKRMFKGGNL